MADPKKFKSIGIDTDTYHKLKRICDDERRNVRQQISIWVDKDYSNRFKEDDKLYIAPVIAGAGGRAGVIIAVVAIKRRR